MTKIDKNVPENRDLGNGFNGYVQKRIVAVSIGVVFLVCAANEHGNDFVFYSAVEPPTFSNRVSEAFFLFGLTRGNQAERLCKHGIGAVSIGVVFPLCAANEHGNDFVFYSAVEPRSLIAFLRHFYIYIYVYIYMYI